MVQVPSYAVPYIKAAAAGTNLPYALVACQVNDESGFNAGAVSSAGAEGPYQFLPSTFYSVASGSPFSWKDSTYAYIVYMNNLLRDFHGNVRDALAAYNAGPGNIGAGLGYADSIIACSGAAVSTVNAGNVSVLPFPLLGTPNVQADDWSWWITQSSHHVQDLANTARFWSVYIGRL